MRRSYSPHRHAAPRGGGQSSIAVANNEQALSVLASYAAADETLVHGVVVTLPLTKQTYYKGKFISKPTGALSVRAYNATTSAQQAWAKLEATEAQMRRVQYGAWQSAHLKQLKQAPQSKVFTASLWLAGKLPPPGGSKSGVAAQMSQVKKPIRTHLKGTSAAEIWDDPTAPMLVVKGDAGTITLLGFHPNVGRAFLHADKPGTILTAAGADGQERLDMSYPTLVAAHGPILNDQYGPVVMWDACAPHDSVTHSNPPGQYRYIPLGPVYGGREVGECTGNKLLSSQSHSSRTLGIVAGRVDGYYVKGIDGFLPSLPSIWLATMGDLNGQPNGELRMMQRMATVAANHPVVQSTSAYFVDYNGTPPFCTGNTVEAWHVYADWLSVNYNNLNIYSAGNIMASSTGCSDPHFVWPKQKNAIIVGGYDDGNATPPTSTMFEDSLDDYSSWKSPSSTHGDIRVPHLSAVGNYVQSVDPWWRFDTFQGPKPPDGSYEMCDKQTDEPLMRNSTTGSWTDPVIGTSYAAPQAAALAAYAMRHTRCRWGYSQLAVQGARALLIASADRQVTVTPPVSELCGQPPAPCPARTYRLVTGEAGANERRWAAGAGAVSASRLAHLVPSFCVWSPHIVTGFFDPNGSLEPLPGYHQTGGRPGETRRCRFALAWPPNPSCPEGTCVPGGDYRGHDLDIYVWAGGQLLSHAASFDNNYEFMDFDCPAATILYWEVRITPDPGTTDVDWALVKYDSELP